MRMAKLLIVASLLLPCSLAHADVITESVVVHAEHVSFGGITLYFDLSYLLTFDPSLTYTDATAGLSLVSATSVNGTQYLPTFHVPTGFNYAPNSYLDIGGLPLGVIGGNPFTDDFLVEIGLSPLILSHPTIVYPPPRIIAIDVASADPSLGGVFGILSLGGGTPAGTSVSITQIANPVPTPEPSSFALLGTALLAGAGFLRRRLQQESAILPQRS